jgi:hypothetical protein
MRARSILIVPSQEDAVDPNFGTQTKWWQDITNPASVPDALGDMRSALEIALERMRHHGPRSGGILESRELSLAITNAEQALMWLEKVPTPK